MNSNSPKPSEPTGGMTSEGFPSEGFRVRIAKDYLQFCAAHCITREDGSAEPLHGHNYRVSVVVQGSLLPNAHYVMDFVTLKAATRKLVNEWDHRVLLAAENPLLPVEASADGVTMTTPGGSVYRFPRQDVCLLPVPNTTAEMLAWRLAKRLRAEIGDRAGLTSIEVEVEETPGQSATYRDIVTHP